MCYIIHIIVLLCWFVIICLIHYYDSIVLIWYAHNHDIVYMISSSMIWPGVDSVIQQGWSQEQKARR